MAKRQFETTNTLRIGLKRSDIARPVAMPDRRTAELLRTQTLEAEQKLFAELLENVYDAVIVTELDGRIVKTNRRAGDHFQYTRAEFFRLGILDLISGATEDLILTTREYLKNQQHVFIEAYGRRQNGTFFPCEVTANLLHLQDEEHLCFFIRNVTVKREAEEALRKAQDELMRSAHGAGMAAIATGVLHDVGNILNSIGVSTDVIVSELKSSALRPLTRLNALVAEHLSAIGEFIASDPKGQRIPELYLGLGKKLRVEHERMRREADNLAGKVAAIRDVIRTQQSYAKADLFVEKAPLAEVVEDAVALQQATLERLNVTVQREFGELPAVAVEKTKLLHILTNLICNAADAMMSLPPAERILTVKTGKQGDDAYVSVTDNGAGITKENLKRIFNHGFTTKADGHGFGLHTCANFMTEMGGRISARSHGPGAGATFSLLLPLATTQENDA